MNSTEDEKDRQAVKDVIAGKQMMGILSHRPREWPFQATDEDGFPVTLEHVIEQLTPEQRRVEAVLYDFSNGRKGEVIDRAVITLTSDGPFIYDRAKE